MTYTFGDSELASLRLRLLADVYAGCSSRFLGSLGLRELGTCVDLGCGPGYTTELVQRVLSPRRVVGLEISPAFVAEARARAPHGVEFMEHDATRVPFPVPPAELLYCRFLLTHIRDPQRVLGDWASQLVRHGLLLIEEVEAMRTAHTLLASYYAIVEAMQRHHGQEMYLGSRLRERVPPALQVAETRLECFTIPVAQMARLHHLNIQNWRQNAFVREHYAQAELDRIERGLGELAADPEHPGVVDFGMRQLVLTVAGAPR